MNLSYSLFPYMLTNQYLSILLHCLSLFFLMSSNISLYSPTLSFFLFPYIYQYLSLFSFNVFLSFSLCLPISYSLFLWKQVFCFPFIFFLMNAHAVAGTEYSSWPREKVKEKESEYDDKNTIRFNSNWSNVTIVFKMQKVNSNRLANPLRYFMLIGSLKRMWQRIHRPCKLCSTHKKREKEMEEGKGMKGKQDWKKNGMVLSSRTIQKRHWNSDFFSSYFVRQILLTSFFSSPRKT